MVDFGQVLGTLFASKHLRLAAGEALVHHLHFNSKAPVQTAGKLARPAGEIALAIVHIQGQANHHQIRLPLLQQLIHLGPVGYTIHRFEDRDALGGIGQGLAAGNADLFQAVVKTQQAFTLAPSAMASLVGEHSQVQANTESRGGGTVCALGVKNNIGIRWNRKPAVFTQLLFQLPPSQLV